jgi:biotin carboxylase
MKKKLLVLQAGISQARIIQIAKNMGLSVIALDRNEHAPGLEIADFSEVVDPNDIYESLKIAKKYDVDGVLPGGDVSLKTAAYIAENLNLVGLSTEQADVATDKEKYVCMFKKSGIPYSESQVTDNIFDCRNFIKDFGFPVILKPTLSFGGSRGVIRINNMKELSDGFEYSKQFSQNGRIIIEAFYDGQEHTVESIIYNNKNHVLAISDKERVSDKYCLATSLNYYSQLPEHINEEIEKISQQIASSLQISNWITHTEMITIDDEVKVIDFGARGGGAGYIPSIIVPNVCGVNMMEEFIRILLNETPKNLFK